PAQILEPFGGFSLGGRDVVAIGCPRRVVRAGVATGSCGTRGVLGVPQRAGVRVDPPTVTNGRARLLRSVLAGGVGHFSSLSSSTISASTTSSSSPDVAPASPADAPSASGPPSAPASLGSA